MNIESSESISTSQRRIFHVLIPALAVLILTQAGCGYPKVSATAFELAKALNTVCNQKNADQLTAFRDLVEEKHAEGEITDGERKLLLNIAQTAESGDWKSAEHETRKLLKDQNERRS